MRNYPRRTDAQTGVCQLQLPVTDSKASKASRAANLLPAAASSLLLRLGSTRACQDLPRLTVFSASPRLGTNSSSKQTSAWVQAFPYLTPYPGFPRLVFHRDVSSLFGRDGIEIKDIDGNEAAELKVLRVFTEWGLSSCCSGRSGRHARGTPSAGPAHGLRRVDAARPRRPAQE